MKYIVSNLANVQPGNGNQEYNHESVKLAYKAGAVVEFLLDEKWKRLAYPSWFSDEKYRAIVTPDMPKEIQDLVNWYKGDATPFIQQIGRATRCPDVKFSPEPQRMKWADVIVAMANGEKGQWRHANSSWIDGYDYNPMSFPEYEWRIKPKTITIGDTEVPAPETKAPERDQEYFIADPLEETRLYKYYKFRNDEFDRHCLRSGMIHLTAQAAQEHALALIKVSGGQHPDDYEVAK